MEVNDFRKKQILKEKKVENKKSGHKNRQRGQCLLYQFFTAPFQLP